MVHYIPVKYKCERGKNSSETEILMNKSKICSPHIFLLPALYLESRKEFAFQGDMHLKY